MVEELTLTPRAFKRLVPRLRTKVSGCLTPLCWEIREPIKVHEKMYLGPKDTGRQKGYYASVRRILFLWDYQFLPRTKIHMACGNTKCASPAHARVSGFEAQLNKEIPRQIKDGFLYPDDAEKWFGYQTPKEETAVVV